MGFCKALLFLLWLFVSSTIGLIACLLRPFGVDANVVAAHIFGFGALKICGLRLNLTGAENLTAQTPCIYVGNHQTGMDMATYGKILPPHTKVIGKTELRWFPIFGFFLWAAGNILIKRSSRDKSISSLDQAVSVIRKKNVSIWIFPEGTRNRECRGLLPFKKGAFHMAIAAGVPIVPLVSSTLKGIGVLETLDLNGGVLNIKVLPPIPTMGLTKADVDVLSQKVRETMLAALAEFER